MKSKRWNLNINNYKYYILILRPLIPKVFRTNYRTYTLRAYCEYPTILSRLRGFAQNVNIQIRLALDFGENSKESIVSDFVTISFIST
jgi:hypothetical protein